MINLYGNEIKILAGKNVMINSTFSKILTLLTIIIIIIFTWIIGNDVIYKINPLSYINQIITNFHPKIKITSENFPFAIGLFGPSNLPMFNSSIIEVTLHKNFMKFDQITGETIESITQEIKLKSCTYENFPSISKEVFDNNIIF